MKATRYGKYILAVLVFLSMAVYGCPSKKETLSGKMIIPQGQKLDMTFIAATMNGKEVAQAKVDPISGNFSIELPGTGTYDLLLKTPKGNVPYIISKSVEVGEQVVIEPLDAPVDLFDEEPPVDVEPPSTVSEPPSTVSEPPSTVTEPPSTVSTKPIGPVDQPTGTTATLKGTVHPEEADVMLMADGEVVMQTKAKGGKFEMHSVIPGLYEVQFSAPGYASAMVDNVMVPADAEPKDLSGFLLYQSPLDGVDWDKGVITATGIGQPNPDMPAAASAVGACRAAKVDAFRKLLDTLLKIQVDPDKSIASMDSEGSFRSSLNGFVQGAKVVQEVKNSDGTCEVTLQIPIVGPSGVTSFLQQKIEQ